MKNHTMAPLPKIATCCDLQFFQHAPQPRFDLVFYGCTLQLFPSCRVNETRCCNTELTLDLAPNPHIYFYFKVEFTGCTSRNSKETKNISEHRKCCLYSNVVTWLLLLYFKKCTINVTVITVQQPAPLEKWY